MNRKSKSSDRRRSRSLAGYASKGFCETIPKCLDPSERLLKLIELSFQYALSTVQKEILPDDFDLTVFRQRGSEIWEKVRSSIEEKNLIQLAVSENGIPSNSFSSENVEEYHKTVKVLEAESNKWREQFSCYRDSLKRKIGSPYIIDASMWNEKERLYDYSDIIQSTTSAQEKLSKQISSLSKYKNAYKSSLQINKNLNRKLLLRCQNYLKQNASHSPRTVIRSMMSSRRSNNGYSFVK